MKQIIKTISKQLFLMVISLSCCHCSSKPISLVLGADAEHNPSYTFQSYDKLQRKTHKCDCYKGFATFCGDVLPFKPNSRFLIVDKRKKVLTSFSVPERFSVDFANSVLVEYNLKEDKVVVTFENFVVTGKYESAFSGVVSHSSSLVYKHGLLVKNNQSIPGAEFVSNVEITKFNLVSIEDCDYADRIGVRTLKPTSLHFKGWLYKKTVSIMCMIHMTISRKSNVIKDI